jgi:TolA-binding protein
MFRNLGGLVLVLGIGGVLVHSSSSSADRPKSGQEKRDDQKVQQAKKDVAKAEDRLRDSIREFEQRNRARERAWQEHRQASERLNQIRAQAQERHEEALGISEAFAAKRPIELAFDQASLKVLEPLRSTPAYQVALKRAQAGQAQIQALRAVSQALSDKDVVLARAYRDAAAVTELERMTLDTDHGLKELRDRLNAAKQRIADMRAKAQSLANSDPAVVGARKALAEGDAALLNAIKRIGDLMIEVEEKRQHLAREKAQLQQAIQQDKRNDKKDKK